jgi:hypothetical protein
MVVETKMIVSGQLGWLGCTSRGGFMYTCLMFIRSRLMGGWCEATLCRGIHAATGRGVLLTKLPQTVWTGCDRVGSGRGGIR